MPNAKYKKTKKLSEGEKEACRVFGTLEVKKVTGELYPLILQACEAILMSCLPANLHITALGHGYASSHHTDHSLMNMSHIISEFSFGPFFPEIVQPLDNSVEITHHRK